MPLPDDTDFLDHKVSDIVRHMAKGDPEASLYVAQHGADYEKGIPPEVMILVARGDSAPILYDVFREIAERYGLEFREEY